jgi:hypothetical protein
MNRREFLGCAANGMGAVALAQLLGRSQLLGPGSAPQGEGEAGAPPVHERRGEPDGHVRLQAGLEKRHGQKFDPGAGIRVGSGDEHAGARC